MIGTDMMMPELYLFNTDTDQRIRLDLEKDPMYPGGAPLHTIIMPDGRKAYLTVMSSDKDPATILALKIGKIDWNAGTADVKITKVLRAVEPGEPVSMLVPKQTHPSQPVVAAMWVPGNHQVHGPTLRPDRKFIYFTQWTDNKIRVVDTSTDQLAEVDPIQHSTLTRQMHGVFFNPAGTKALGTGYYYDLNFVTLWNPDKASGNLEPDKQIYLTGKDPKEYGAFTHFVAWLDNRYAVTGAQQIGPTSLTPAGFKVVGPSVWLVDTVAGTAKMIIGPTKNPNEAGIYKPASDLALIGNKLYVGEEDSMDDEVNADGYVSIWDFTDPKAPRFLKRLGPGKGLPRDFTIGHELYPADEGKTLYVQSWQSAHLAKIDTSTDEVVKVYSKESEGWHMPHGNFVVGYIR